MSAKENSQDKKYSSDTSIYHERSVAKRIEAFFRNNVGLVVLREQLINVARDPVTGKDPENWHQRLSEMRTDKGYTILSHMTRTWLSPGEYLMPSLERTAKKKATGKRVLIGKIAREAVLERANHCCEWEVDGRPCGLRDGDQDPNGGSVVKLSFDHSTPHSQDANTDPNDPKQWLLLCHRHQMIKRNFFDSATGKINIIAVLDAASWRDKKKAYAHLASCLKEE